MVGLADLADLAVWGAKEGAEEGAEEGTGGASHGCGRGRIRGILFDRGQRPRATQSSPGSRLYGPASLGGLPSRRLPTRRGGAALQEVGGCQGASL